MLPRPTHVRALQIGFLVLLATCFAQATYWIVDQVLYTSAVRERLEAHHAADAEAARRLLELGSEVDEVRALFPHLVLSAGDSSEHSAGIGGVRVEQDYIEALARERYRRLNRYGWEGAFFLLVLLGSMAVIFQALRQSGELVRRQQNFLAAVSHELKSPLASLRLSAETLLLRELDLAATRRLADRMVAEVERLEVMVTEILDSARLGEKHAAPEQVRLELQDEVEHVVKEVGGPAASPRIALTTDVPAELAVWGDPIALRTVLSNLLRNALQSVAAAGTGSVHLSARAAGAQVEIVVRDDGTGFDPAESEKLFEKFYRPGDELRRRTRGTGLGLYLVASYVALAGGRVEAHSDGPGRGASFRVLLPAAPERERVA